MPARVIAAVDPEDMADQASALLLAFIEKALGERKRAHLILAGGGTPRATYSLLAAGITQRRLPGEWIHWYFGDERWVPRGDPQSNEGMARASVLGPLGAREETIHSWHAGVGDPVECAAAYRVDIVPDILILGMGPDGHTASLFPGANGPAAGRDRRARERLAPGGGRGHRARRRQRVAADAVPRYTAGRAGGRLPRERGGQGTGVPQGRQR